MKRFVKSVLPASLALAVVACGGSPTGTDSGDPLTEQEIQAVLDALGGSLGGITTFSAVNGGVAPGLNFSVSSEPIDITLNSTAPCPVSGNLAFDGSMNGDIDTQTGQGSIDVVFTWNINNCGVNAQGNTITLQGDPSIAFDATFTITADTFDMDGTYVGGFSYTSSDGRSGSCAIDLSFTSNVNTSTGSVSGGYNGTVCGIQGSAFATFNT